MASISDTDLLPIPKKLNSSNDIIIKLPINTAKKLRGKYKWLVGFVYNPNKADKLYSTFDAYYEDEARKYPIEQWDLMESIIGLKHLNKGYIEGALVHTIPSKIAFVALVGDGMKKPFITYYSEFTNETKVKKYLK